MIRLKVSHEPRSAPCLVSDSTAYSEQVGMNLQLAGVSGEMQYLYTRTKKISMKRMLYFRAGPLGTVSAPGLRSAAESDSVRIGFRSRSTSASLSRFACTPRLATII
jgi:hypothetical protein